MLEGTGAADERGAALGRWADTGAAPLLVPVAGAGAAAGVDAALRETPAAEGAANAGLGAPVGPPGGSVGNLIVGAAVGLGGKLMRTVSFLGCTLPVDFFNGSAPVGAPGNGLFGGKSAIVFN